VKWVQTSGASIPFVNKAAAIMNDNCIGGVLPVGGDQNGAEERAVTVRDRLACMLARHCGARVQTAFLCPAQPSFRFRLQPPAHAA